MQAIISSRIHRALADLWPATVSPAMLPREPEGPDDDQKGQEKRHDASRKASTIPSCTRRGLRTRKPRTQGVERECLPRHANRRIDP